MFFMEALWFHAYYEFCGAELLEIVHKKQNNSSILKIHWKYFLHP